MLYRLTEKFLRMVKERMSEMGEGREGMEVWGWKGEIPEGFVWYLTPGSTPQLPGV
jgi:hypothetical protein